MDILLDVELLISMNLFPMNRIFNYRNSLEIENLRIRDQSISRSHSVDHSWAIVIKRELNWGEEERLMPSLKLSNVWLQVDREIYSELKILRIFHSHLVELSTTILNWLFLGVQRSGEKVGTPVRHRGLMFTGNAFISTLYITGVPISQDPKTGDRELVCGGNKEP